MAKKCLRTIRKDTDRFWCISASFTSSYLAAGYDNGFILFKL